MSRLSLTHACHDPAHCNVPGLFQSIKRGERRNKKLDVVYELKNGRRLKFSGPEPLGADDLRVLQGLVALAGQGGLDLLVEPSTDAGRQVRGALDLRWDAIRDKAIVVRGSYRGLAREIGYKNTDDTSAIRDCIERLWKVSIIAHQNGERRGYRLLADYTSDDRIGRLYVALNPLLAVAVTGGRHVRINLAEVRAIKGDATRIIHQRLCGWIDPCKSRLVELDTLCSYAWPEVAASTSALKARRARGRKALAELAGIGWAVNEYANAKFEIKRPAPR